MLHQVLCMEHDEYQVKFYKDGNHNEAEDYFTDDKGDAQGTAETETNRMNGKKESEMSESTSNDLVNSILMGDNDGAMESFKFAMTERLLNQFSNMRFDIAKDIQKEEKEIKAMQADINKMAAQQELEQEQEEQSAATQQQQQNGNTIPEPLPQMQNKGQN